MLYAVIDTSVLSLHDKLVGYNESKSVVSQYYFSLKKLENSAKYKMVRCKKKFIKKIPAYYDYYLVRFGRNYIPSKYYDLVKDDVYTLIFEYKHVMEILSRTYELGNIDDYERHSIEKTMETVQKLLDEELDGAIPPDMLKEIERRMEEFSYNSFYKTELDENDYIPFFDYTD